MYILHKERLSSSVLEIDLDVISLVRERLCSGIPSQLPKDEALGHEVRRQLIEISLRHIPVDLLQLLS